MASRLGANLRTSGRQFCLYALICSVRRQARSTSSRATRCSADQPAVDIERLPRACRRQQSQQQDASTHDKAQSHVLLAHAETVCVPDVPRQVRSLSDQRTVPRPPLGACRTRTVRSSRGRGRERGRQIGRQHFRAQVLAQSCMDQPLRTRSSERSGRGRDQDSPTVMGARELWELDRQPMRCYGLLLRWTLPRSVSQITLRPVIVSLLTPVEMGTSSAG